VQRAPYLRRTAHAVRYIQSIDSTGLSTGTYENIARNVTTGADVTVSVRRGPVSLFGGGSGYRYSSEAGQLSTTAFVWSARGNATVRLSAVTNVQLFLNYRAPIRTEGGVQSAFVFTNLSLRRLLWKGAGTLTVRAADPLNLSKYGFRTNDGRTVSLTERQFGFRGLFLTVSRNFGKQIKLRSREQDDQSPPTPPGAP
jgi:hypothetical protein